MVNGAETIDGSTKRDRVLKMLVANYAPQAARAAVRALLTLDLQLGDIVRTTREPLVGQMRLTWWAEALEQLDAAQPPAEPVLAALAADALPRGVGGGALAAMVDGWEILLDPGVPTDADLARYADARGAALFRAVATVCAIAADERIEAAGRGWALADLARNVTDRDLTLRADALAAPLLDMAARHRWSRRGRALGALVLLARTTPDAGPGLIARLLFHRAIGL